MIDKDQNNQPSLWEQTMSLGKLLMALAEKDPTATPSKAASNAFAHWLAAARMQSEEARYFDDVAENFDVEMHTTGELFELFEMLHPYLDVEPPEDDAPPKAFISLPLSS